MFDFECCGQRIHRGDSVNSMSTMTSAQATSPLETHVFSTCRCLQELSSLLALLKEISRIQDPLEPGSVLVAAREALSRWGRHSDCDTCEQKDDEDILVVFVMGLREMLCLIHRISRPERHQNGDKTGPIPVRQPRNLFNPELHETLEVPVLSSSTKCSFLGTYELSKEEELDVVNILLYWILEDINHTTKHIKQRSTRPLVNLSEVNNSAPRRLSPDYSGVIPSRSSSEDAIGSSDDGSTPEKAWSDFEESFHSLGKSVDSLRRTLQCSF